MVQDTPFIRMLVGVKAFAPLDCESATWPTLIVLPFV